MNNRVLALLVVHCVGGILSAVLSANRPAVSSAILIALVLSQSSLLGMWGGLGHSHWMIRLLLVLVSTVYLYAELGLGIGELDWEIYFLVALATFLVGFVCWIIRLVRAVLRTDVHVLANTREGLQFSIRHLMQLTIVVACLMTIGKLLAPSVRGLDSMAQLSTLGLCYAAVALTSIWAILGLGHPAFRSVFVILIAVAAGLAGGYVTDRGSHLGFWASTTVLQAAMLVGSLFVIRGMGYRLVAKTPTEYDAAS